MKTLALLFLAGMVSNALCQTTSLRLPQRSPSALSGSEFEKEVSGLGQQEREDRIWREVTSGNVPDFLRRLVPVPVFAANDGAVAGHIFVAPDYLAVGSNDDYFFVSITPYTAQRIADRLGCMLPTTRMVDEIYRAAQLRLEPSPIPPSPAMTTVPVLLDHDRTVGEQRAEVLDRFPLGTLVAGDKKDLVICRGLSSSPGHVAIYGWHKRDGRPIQPLYLGHFAYWTDYSQGTRLVSRTMEIGGKQVAVDRVLADPVLSALLSDEGPLHSTRYHFETFPKPDDPTIHLPAGERLETFAPVPDVRVVIDEPEQLREKVRLVIFALPNGNTIEQTFGRKLRPDDDWHYDIQHIGAQTRFLRQLAGEESLAVAYVEAGNHAWPAWLRSHGAGMSTRIIEAITSRFTGHDLRVALDSHSGGGALLFAYLATVDQIPALIDRIAFIDSEYAYDTSIHGAKLAEWLRADGHSLCVIAYDDSVVRVDGKPVVTADGGTWGRSHAMLADLGREFDIKRVNTNDPERYEGLSGRITFLLKANPRAQIFHTVQVELNGFIESLLSGTTLDGHGYRYFGRRAYSRFIER